jgi:hypothetical protein
MQANVGLQTLWESLEDAVHVYAVSVCPSVLQICITRILIIIILREEFDSLENILLISVLAGLEFGGNE